MGEEARDLGVPRKEWILMNHAMKEKYFANGLREFLADDYFFVGVMIGTALLQNGQLPYFLPLHVIDRLVNKREVDKCVINIQWGLDVFKLTRVFRNKPIMPHPLRPSNATLSSVVLLKLLKPAFAQDGSTAYAKEKRGLCLFRKVCASSSQRKKASIEVKFNSNFCDRGSRRACSWFHHGPIYHTVLFSQNNTTGRCHHYHKS